MATIFGTQGNNTLNGSIDDDIIFARGGADTVTGGGGNDVVLFEISPAGNDFFDGGAGDDGALLDLEFGRFALSPLNAVNTANQLILVDTVDNVTLTLTNVEQIGFYDAVGRIVGFGSEIAGIGAALAASAGGDAVFVQGGSYSGNFSIGTAVSLFGVDSDGQGVSVGSASGTVFTIAGNLNTSAPSGSGEVLFDNIAVGDGSYGISVMADTQLDSLVVSNASFSDLSSFGVLVGYGAADLGSVTISDSSFTDIAATGAVTENGVGSIVLQAFTGDLRLDNVVITNSLTEADAVNTRPDNAIQISGRDLDTYDVTSPAGAITLHDVTIEGTFHKNALTIQGYTDLSGITFDNVSITGAADWGYLVFIDPISTSGTDGPGLDGYPGHFAGGAETSTLDLAGLTVNNLSTHDVGYDVFVRGSDAADIQTGTDARDVLNAHAEGGIDYGGDDVLNGGGGADTLYAGLGDDTLDGGAGVDTAIYTGSVGDYTLAEVRDANGRVTAFTGATDTNALDGDDGTDTFASVEVVQFADAVLDLSLGVQIFDAGDNLVGTFATIQEAIDEAQTDYTIRIGAGTYSENVVIDVDGLTILGAPGAVLEGTFLTDNAVTGPLNEWLEGRAAYTGVAGTGVSIEADGVTIDGLTISGFLHAIDLNGDQVGTVLTNLLLTSNFMGLHKPGEVEVTDFTFTDTVISDGHIGVDITASQLGGWFDQIVFNNVDVSDMNRKGYYFEALSNAVLSNFEMTNVGEWGGIPATGSNGQGGNGINLNLKFDDFANIDISDFVLTDVGSSNRDGLDGAGHANGGAIIVAARDDGGTYGADPATLSNVTIHDGSIDGTSTGIGVGEPAKANADPDVTVTEVTITNAQNNAQHGEFGNQSAGTLTVTGTDGNDTYEASGNSDGAIVIDGGAGDDILSTGSADDQLTGGAGNDTLDGNGGIDTVVVGTGAQFVANGADWAVTSIDGTDMLVDIEIVEDGDGGRTLLVGSSGFATIQEAVDAAADGDTILIAAGTYQEQILIDGKDLTIVADDGAVLEMPDTANVVSSGGYYSALTVLGAAVDIVNLDIDGRGQGGPFVTQTFAGVAFINADGSSFADGHVTGFHAPPAQAGNQHGYGILVRSTDGHPHSVEISGSTIDGFQKNGIDARGAGLSVDIHDNAITGAGATAMPAQNGVVILGATGVVHQNVISALGYTGTDTIATGVLVYDSDEVTVTDNVITMAGTETASTAIHLFDSEPGIISGNVVAGTLTGIEQTGDYTGLGLDLLHGNGGNNFLDGGDDDDDLAGGGGNDLLTGGAGNDVLDGGIGADIMGGGLGNDTYRVDSILDLVIENASEGLDTVETNLSAYALGDNVENLIYTGIGDFTGRGNAEDNVLTGGDGHDELRGLGGNDTIYGLDGNDRIFGNKGSDTLVGGDGNDTYNISTTTAVIVELDGGGTDRVLSSQVDIDLSLFANVEIGRLAGTLDLDLGGSAGDDRLIGNNGDNVLSGGAGRDELFGGAGADTFDFDGIGDTAATKGQADLIQDFQGGLTGEDVIDLRDVDAKAAAAGNNAFVWIGTDAFSGHEGELRYRFVGDQTRIDADINGDGVEDFTIMLNGHVDLYDGNFVL